MELENMSKNKILVIDDNPVVLKAMQGRLQSDGFDVVTSADGSEGIQRARRERPDLILLDLNFPPDVAGSGPAWDGFRIMEWLQRVVTIPIIVITGEQSPDLRDRVLKAGAAGMFQKPMDHGALLTAISRTIESRQPATTVPRLDNETAFVRLKMAGSPD